MFEITFKPELNSDSVCPCYFCYTIDRKLPKSTNIEYLVAFCPRETEVQFSFMLERLAIAQSLVNVYMR